MQRSERSCSIPPSLRASGAFAAVLLALGLPLTVGGSCEDSQDGTSSSFSLHRSTVNTPGPAGASCVGLQSCPHEQFCSAGVCRHLKTSLAGEILAIGAKNQMAAGDLEGALKTFEQARSRFEQFDVPLPPGVACGAAIAALRLADDEESREQGARSADRCFRHSVPGYGLREEVQSAIAKLRFDGIDLSLFDTPEPAQTFFVDEPSRPTADAIQVSIDLPSSTVSGFEELQRALLSEQARVVISECFVKDWERRHERSVSAALLLRFKTRLKDMGDYDVFAPEVSVVPAEANGDAFSSCLAEALTASLQPGPRVSRTVSAWQEAFHVQTSVP